MDDWLANSGDWEATTKSGIKSDMESMFKLSQTLDTSVQMTQKELDDRLEELKSHFDERQRAMRDFTAAVDNSAAVMANGRVNRLHAEITPIQVLLHPDDPDRSGWRPHVFVPKTMRDVYRLGQRAKGLFPSKHNAQTKAKERRDEIEYHELTAQSQIATLADYYGVRVLSFNMEDPDASAVIPVPDAVDMYMEDILTVWGMDWSKVCELAVAASTPQSQQAGQKRSGKTDKEKEKKKRVREDDHK